MGWSSEQLNTIALEFVDFCRSGACSSEESAALDIGAAYGTATIAALRAGAHVIANDLDAGHLARLRELVYAAPGLGPEVAALRLRTKEARFPRDVWYSDETLGAVLASNVFHFLTGNQVERGIRLIARWLRPGGKLFIHAATPWQKAFEGFLPEYERRLVAGEKWPGWIERLGVWSKHKKFSQMPRAIHLLDDAILRRETEAAGLTVEKLWLYRRADLPRMLWMDGRENVGLIACKHSSIE